jgi:hypothetical protein
LSVFSFIRFLSPETAASTKFHIHFPFLRIKISVYDRYGSIGLHLFIL